MQDKTEFNQLPKEILDLLANSYLSIPSLSKLTQASKNHWMLFKPRLEEQILCKFLLYVVHGNYYAVKEMLSKNFHLIVKKARVTDYSGRIFESISGFEYTIWSLDKLMCTTMLHCLPNNQESQALRGQLHKQYEKAKTLGLSYFLNGEQFTEKHFDFENTIKVLQEQIDSLNIQESDHNIAVEKQWKEGASAQKLLPVHLFHQIGFTSNWLAETFALFDDYLICKRDTSLRLKLHWQGRNYNSGSSDIILDLNDITRLCKANMEDLNTLELQFGEEIKAHFLQI